MVNVDFESGHWSHLNVNLSTSILKVFKTTFKRPTRLPKRLANRPHTKCLVQPIFFISVSNETGRRNLWKRTSSSSRDSRPVKVSVMTVTITGLTCLHGIHVSRVWYSIFIVTVRAPPKVHVVLRCVCLLCISEEIYRSTVDIDAQLSMQYIRKPYTHAKWKRVLLPSALRVQPVSWIHWRWPLAGQWLTFICSEIEPESYAIGQNM